jgi:double-stranded uracil-DNA glycosylase
VSRKPTKEELAAAIDRTVDDLIAPGLKVLFCGINPGLWSGATGRHFARPGNRFWKALHLSGITPRQLDPSEADELLELGYGITCFVGRTTARADELTKEEFIEGGEIVRRKVLAYRPGILAVLGLGAYRIAYSQPDARLGLQHEAIGETRVWLLPNPSGLNAHYQLADFGELFAEVRRAAEGSGRSAAFGPGQANI